MAGYGTPLGYGEGLYGETFVPGGQGTVLVELDDGTDTFPYDITAYVLKAEGISFSRGRQDEQSAVAAGQMTLTLNNSDGRFTVGSTTIASPSPIKMDQRIRFRETVNGTTYTRFTGYAKQWPVAWPAVVPTVATAQIVVTDAQARAERRVLRSVIEEEILLGKPPAYYTLGEPAGAASASDSSGNQAPALAQAGAGTDIVFGNAAGPSTDGLTAAEVGDGKKYLLGYTGVPVCRAVLCAFSLATPPSAFTAMLVELAAGQLGINTAGKLTGPGGLVSPNAVTDGANHVAGLRYSGTTLSLLLDGVAVASLSSSSTGDASWVAVGNWTGTGVSGVIGHVAIFDTDPGATLLADMSTSMLTGFAGEAGTARLARLASYAGLPVGTLDASLTNVAFTDFTGRSLWDAIQEVADAEMGTAYFDGAGNLTFHNRNRVVIKTAPDLTLTNYELTPEVQPVVDDADLVNYVEVSANGQPAQIVRDAASENAHGRYAESRTYLVQTLDEALDRGRWLIVTHKEPGARYGTLTLNLWAMTAATAASVLAGVDLGTWLQVTGFPSQTPGGTTVDVVVEGYSERISSGEWTLTLNVSDKSLTDCLILDDPTRGVLDAGYRLYV